ncbi:mCG146251, partial [Mus musculus]
RGGGTQQLQGQGTIVSDCVDTDSKLLAESSLLEKSMALLTVRNPKLIFQWRHTGKRGWVLKDHYISTADWGYGCHWTSLSDQATTLTSKSCTI